MANPIHIQRKVSYSCLAACFLVLAGGSLRATPSNPPESVIFDTEMSSDCDSVGALAVANKLADLGEVKILACVADAVEPDKAIAATISAINTYYGRPQIPIGTYKSVRIRPGRSSYTAHIRDEFPHGAVPDDQEPNALDIYRTALAAAPDHSVTILSLGFLVNLRDLLQSKPDSASPLTGPDLIRRKVKQLVVVGGRFKQSDILQQKYPEYNFGGADPKAAPDTRYVVENWPTTILFAGLEIGQGVCTGPSLAATPPTNPVRRIYELFGSLKNPRSSWCQIAVLAAVRDPHLYWNVKGDGYCQVSPAALNAWSNDLHRGHFYLAMKLSQDAMAKIIGQLMAAPPAAH